MMAKRTLVALALVATANAAINSWVKSGGSDLCMGIDSSNSGAKVGAGFCRTSSNVPEYVSMSAEGLTFICDPSDYGTVSNNRADVPLFSGGGATTYSFANSGLSINGQPDCRFAEAGDVAKLGDASSGGYAAATYYIATGSGSCSSSTNSFSYPDGSASGDICISPNGRGDPTNGGTCATQVFTNSAVKFSIVMQSFGSSYSVPTCAGTSPTATHVAGRFVLDSSTVGSGSVFFNDDTSITPATVSGTVVTSITVTSGAFAGENIRFSFPSATQYGTVSGSSFTMTNDGTVSVKAWQKSATETYIDYLFPVGVIDSAEKYVIFDPEIKSSQVNGNGAAAPLVSALMSLGMALVAAVFVF